MEFTNKKLIIKLFLIFNLISFQCVHADNHNISEILEKLQSDIKTLERAVYSGSLQIESQNNNDVNINHNNKIHYHPDLYQ